MAPIAIMTPEHAKLLTEIRGLARPSHREKQINDSYGGSGRPFYNVSVPDRRAIAKRWLAAHKAAPVKEICETIESLFEGESHEEKTLACLFLAMSAPIRASVKPKDIERWLGKLNGWAEVDSLCQNVFTDELSSDWPNWQKLIARLSKSKDINKRRASLVLLTRPSAVFRDAHFRDEAFEVIERLQAERDILITKAVSWLLRSMTTHHRKAVAAFMKANAEMLPKIAIRETNTKPKTGTKSGRNKRAAA
ncbi:MAG: DNA alkylation repair protein [Alphaproteobacteria bacterium]